MRAGEEPQEHLPLSFWKQCSQVYFLGVSVVLPCSIEGYLSKDNVVPRSLFPGTIV